MDALTFVVLLLCVGCGIHAFVNRRVGWTVVFSGFTGLLLALLIIEWFLKVPK